MECSLFMSMHNNKCKHNLFVYYIHEKHRTSEIFSVTKFISNGSISDEIDFPLIIFLKMFILTETEDISIYCQYWYRAKSACILIGKKRAVSEAISLFDMLSCLANA